MTSKKKILFSSLTSVFIAVDGLQPPVDELDNGRAARVLIWNTCGRVGLGPGWLEHGGPALHHCGVPAHCPWYVINTMRLFKIL